MPATSPDLSAIFDRLGIEYSTVEHPPFFTVAEGRPGHDKIPGLPGKNLFMTYQSVIKTTFLLVLDGKRWYSGRMKRDGRQLDHRTLETIRLMAVERVRDGERPSSVVASYGFSRTTIYRWLSAAARPGVGLRALHSRPATGRPRSLTPHQEQQVFRWINGRDPRQYGLDFGLWTRSVVAALIERKFAIRLGVTAVGELLAKVGLTPQKPLQRAYQRDPEAIEAWQRERYPAIARQAKASGGEVYFWDEFGLSRR